MVSPNYLHTQDLRYLDRKRHQEDQVKIIRREKILDEEIERRKEVRLENLRKDVRSRYDVKSVLERQSSDEGSIGEMIDDVLKEIILGNCCDTASV